MLLSLIVSSEQRNLCLTVLNNLPCLRPTLHTNKSSGWSSVRAELGFHQGAHNMAATHTISASRRPLLKSSCYHRYCFSNAAFVK